VASIPGGKEVARKISGKVQGGPDPRLGTDMTVHDIRSNRPSVTSPTRPATRSTTHTAVPSPAPDERRILVALSHPSDRRSVEHALDRLDLVVRSTSDANSTIAMLDAFAPDVVVLDAREFHPALTPVAAAARQMSGVGVVVVGGNSREQRLAALRHGVDDVVSTDTPVDEIALRCVNTSARLMRAAPAPTVADERIRRFGPLTLDLDRREINVNGHAVSSTRLEYELFARICETPFQVVSRTDLIESVWGPNWYGDTHVIDVHLSNLRRKLRQRCSAVDYLHTVRGVGFRLSDDMQDDTRHPVRIAG
jgi:DNA-binding response OmpR family regulator